MYTHLSCRAAVSIEDELLRAAPITPVKWSVPHAGLCRLLPVVDTSFQFHSRTFPYILFWQSIKAECDSWKWQDHVWSFSTVSGPLNRQHTTEQITDYWSAGTMWSKLLKRRSFYFSVSVDYIISVAFRLSQWTINLPQPCKHVNESLNPVKIRICIQVRS